MTINKVIVTGRLARDPRVGTTGQKQTKYACICLVIDEPVSENGNISWKPIFIDGIFAYGSVAEYIERKGKKGSALTFEGRLTQIPESKDEKTGTVYPAHLGLKADNIYFSPSGNNNTNLNADPASNVNQQQTQNPFAGFQTQEMTYPNGMPQPQQAPLPSAGFTGFDGFNMNDFKIR